MRKALFSPLKKKEIKLKIVVDPSLCEESRFAPLLHVHGLCLGNEGRGHRAQPLGTSGATVVARA